MTDTFVRAISRTSYAGGGGGTITRSYIRANYIEANLEEDSDMKNHSKIINLPNPTLIQDPATNHYEDNKTLNSVLNSEIDNTTIVRTYKIINFNGNTSLGCESV